MHAWFCYNFSYITHKRIIERAVFILIIVWCLSMPHANLRFTYSGYEIIEPLGENPQLSILVKVKLVEIKGGNYVYLPPLTCKIELYSVDSFSPGGGSVIGNLGVFHTDSSLLLTEGKEDVTRLLVPITSPKIEKVIDIRRTNRLVSLVITLNGFYFVCDGDRNHVKAIVPIYANVMKYAPDGKETHYIVFSTEEITDIIQRVKHYQLVRFEIPVYKLGKQSDKDIAKALNLLQSASKKLEANDIIGALKDVRDTVMNHLVIRVKEGESYRNKLRDNIAEAYLRNVPEEARTEYEKSILKGIEGQLNSLLQNVISKFIHLDSDKIERIPLHEDVEFAFSVVLFTTRYIAKYLGR